MTVSTYSYRIKLVTNNYKSARVITFLSIVLTFLFVFATVATAFHTSRGNVLQETDTATDSAKPKGKAKGRDKMKDRLSEVKLKVCEKKESSIQKRSTKLVERADKIQAKIDTVIAKVDTYYIDVLSPKGVEIDNYSDLLANVEENRVVVATALGLAESNAENFNCEGVNPKNHLKEFKDDMKAAISALKNYKKSVVNLIVAVRTKAKNIKDPVATSSANTATSSAETE